MKKILLGLLLVAAQSGFAGDREFLDMCKNADSLPGAQAVTMRSLIKVGSGTFVVEMKPCDEVLAQLKSSKILRLHGQTFEYLTTEDLTPVATLEHLEELDITGQSRTIDLSPLYSLGLKSLSIAGTGVNLRQLEPIKTLESIGIAINPFTSLKPLQELPQLENLVLSPTRDGHAGAISLSQLESTTIKSLRSTVFPIGEADMTFYGFQHLSSLERIVINHGRVDAATLVHLPLKELTMSRGEVRNVQALAAIRSLEVLNLAFQNLESIDFLSQMAEMRELRINDNNITDVAVLANLHKLEILNLANNPVRWDQPLRELDHLRILVLDNTLMSLDASKLTQLERLSIRRTGVFGVGLSPKVVYPNLKRIDASHNRIGSDAVRLLTADTVPALTELNLQGNRIVNVAPISELISLEQLILDDNKISDMSPLSPLVNLKRLSGRYNVLTDLACPIKTGVCDFLHQDT